MNRKQTLRVGVGGPVGSGKTALLRALCSALRDHYDIAVVTNDIYTQENAQFLIRSAVSYTAWAPKTCPPYSDTLS